MAEAPDGQMANLHLDEATGERVSKTELKRRQKQRDIDAKKSAKAATASSSSNPLASAQKNKPSADETDLTPNASFLLLSLRRAHANVYSNIPKSDPRRSKSSKQTRARTPSHTSFMSRPTFINSWRNTAR